MDLNKIYSFYPVKEEQHYKHRAIRVKAKALAELILESCPESRERSIALTHLETAVMWANAAISRE